MEISGNTILVTGGGTGIGRELAREFHEAGNKVIIAGRRSDILDAVAAEHPGMIAMSLDIGDGQAIAGFAERIVADCSQLNVIVNNAGVMAGEDKIDLAVAEAIIATNLLGPLRLTSALLPHLLAQPRAAIVNVSSALAFVPFVQTPTYCASKAALHSWTVSLRAQLRNTAVEVIEIIPPAVQTELQPGLSGSPRAMPLKAFIAETMAQLRHQPTPSEVFGEMAGFLRSPVDADKFSQVLATLNQLEGA